MSSVNVTSRTVVRLQPASATQSAEWDSFVLGHPEARFCHLWGFRRVLETTYRYRCVYLDVLRDSERVGVFPSVAHRGRLISQPFNEYGGPLVSNLSAGEWQGLGAQLADAARTAGCESIEIRGGIGAEGLEQTPFAVRHPLHSYGVLSLQGVDLWRKALTNEARKGVNKAKTAGLVGEVRRGAAAVADPFYQLYLISMKRLGVPPHPRRVFFDLVAGLGDRVVASWVVSAGRNVAVLLGFDVGERLQIYITASEPDFWAQRPNDLAHWELISRAAAQGFRLFDFGSARYSGQIQFKKKWGAELHDYGCLLVGTPGSAELARIHSVETSSKSMQAAANVWSKIVPLSLTPVLGRPIRRYLGK